MTGEDPGLDTSVHSLPQVISHEGKGSAAIEMELLRAKMIDITGGFPVADVRQMEELIQALFTRGVIYVPIMGVREQGLTRAYMLVDLAEEKQTVTALWQERGQPKEVVFTTEMMGWSSTPPRTDPCLKLEGEVYIPFDAMVHIPTYDLKHPLAKGFTPEGQRVMKRIFNIPGVEFRHFAE